jgi:hypothetical protein
MHFPWQLTHVALLAPLLCGGCGSLATPRVAPPKVDPRTAAGEAIRLYDTNADGSLDESELAACPAMKSARDRYDKDGNRQISQDEIAQRLEKVYSNAVGLLEVQCTITRNGQPLSGATVQFIPETFLGDTIHTAVATTNSDGMAIPSIPADQLPEKLRDAALMQVGIYRVEIEHPSLSADGVKKLGFEVDPTRRDGTTARFNL